MKKAHQESPFKLFAVLAQEWGLVVLGAILFALSFPNILFPRGLGFLSFVALIPIYLLIRRVGWIKVVIYGGLYGWSSYALFNYWLLTFSPVAFSVVPTIFFFYGLALFPLLKFSLKLFPQSRPLMFTLVWVGYEFLKTQGFLGYSYGILGYAHWENPLLLQLASWGGVWPLSFLSVFASAWLGEFFDKEKDSKSLLVTGVGYGVLILATLVWGWLSPLDTRAYPTWKTALIQNDMNPWDDGENSYSEGLRRLMALSDQALKSQPQGVIWSETAFIPSIFYHKKYREDGDRYALVETLTEYLHSRKIPFILGNDHGERRALPGKPLGERVDFNSAFLYADGDFQERYDKIHLVPLTENFPFRGILTPVYHYLKSLDTHFWEAGNRLTVFTLPEARFSTPICFEDTFGYLSRDFVRAGAQVLVNISNDSWSGTDVNMYQHFAISVFRAVENRRSLLRSTAGGITAAIDPNGRILGELKPFTQDFLLSEVPVVEGQETLYTLWGDWFPWTLIFLWFVLGSLGLLGSLRKFD